MSSMNTTTILLNLKKKEYNFLEPDKTSIFKDQTEQIRCTIKEHISYLDVRIIRAFPLSDPDRYISLLDEHGKTLGIIENPTLLDPESRTTIQQELTRKYFSPIIQKIRSLKEEFGVIYLDVQTDHGNRSFIVKGLRDSIRYLQDQSLLITDTDGNRYVIKNMDTLDKTSQSLLEQVI